MATATGQCGTAPGGASIDLKRLRRATVRNPGRLYMNLLILAMIRHNVPQAVLREDGPKVRVLTTHGPSEDPWPRSDATLREIHRALTIASGAPEPWWYRALGRFLPFHAVLAARHRLWQPRPAERGRLELLVNGDPFGVSFEVCAAEVPSLVINVESRTRQGACV